MTSRSSAGGTMFEECFGDPSDDDRRIDALEQTIEASMSKIRHAVDTARELGALHAARAERCKAIAARMEGMLR